MLICALFFIIICVFIVAWLLRNTGTFTVTTPRQDMIALGLVVSDEPEFDRPRHELRSPPVVNMWNITESDLPNDIDQIDGPHNGENYLAYTFYIKNTGTRPVIYSATSSIREMYLSVDAAMRVKLYLNGKSSIFAMTAKDGNPEPDTTPFLSASRMFKTEERLLEPGDVDKYTYVVWLEGEDPECVNDILGGFVKLTMDFDGRAKLDAVRV